MRSTNPDEMIRSDDITLLIMEAALDAIICMDKEGIITLWTKQAEKMFGWEEEEVKGKLLSEIIIPPRYRERHKDGLKRYLETGENAILNKVMELEGLKRDGTEFPVELTITSIKQDNGEFFCAFLRDISERKTVEEELRKSEMRYRSLIEQASDPIMITDYRGNFLDVNQSLCRMFGYSKEELLQMNIKALVDQEELKIKPMLFDRLAAGMHVFSERRMIHRNGTIIHVEANVKQVDETCVLAIARDITERKKAQDAIIESETRYRALVENATEALVVYDVEKGQFVNVSQSAEELFKMPKEELLKIGPLEISPRYQPDGRLSSESIMENMSQVIAGKKASFEWTHCDKSGKLIPCEIRLVRLPSENRMLIRGSIIDITERKKAEEEIKASQNALRRLPAYLQAAREEERTSIAREIHDELGQQLTGLKMDAAWLNKKIPLKDTKIHKRISDMLALINNTITTIRHISSELRPRILDDLGLIDALDWQSSEFEKRTGIRCHFKSSLKQRRFEKNLSTGIFRVYQETLTNVARHAEATKINTSLETLNGNIVLKVEDNGKGFDPEEIKNKNTLGLLGMQERAMMFGGMVIINSQKGKGTVVTLQVPGKAVSPKTIPS